MNEQPLRLWEAVSRRGQRVEFLAVSRQQAQVAAERLFGGFGRIQLLREVR